MHSPSANLVHHLHDPLDVIFGPASGLCAHRPRHHNRRTTKQNTRDQEAAGTRAGATSAIPVCPAIGKMANVRRGNANVPVPG